MDALRRIIHLDLDAFFCAVEELHNPALRGKPFAVGGRPHERGVVSSCSYAARQHGVRSAMPMGRALRLCPGMLVVRPNFPAYRAASRQVMARLGAVTPLVEQISIDEAFLEVSSLAEPPEAIARRLQEEIRSQLGLPCSLGVASNKLVAKIATDFGKSQARSAGPPNALTVVPPGSEAGFLAPLPVQALWGVGPKTAAHLAELGITTIGELAAWPEADLARRFGKLGQEIAQRARGLDDRPVVTEHEIKSISQETTFARDVRDPAELLKTLERLGGQVANRLRRQGLYASTVRLKLRWHDFTTLSRQASLHQPLDDPELIIDLARRLFERAWQPGRAVRLLGLGVSGLSAPPLQMSLWESALPEDPHPEAAEGE
jgi:DNA polymerase-4